MRAPDSSLLLHEFPQRYEAVVRFMRRRLGSGDDAREVAHDTWLRLAERARDEAEAGPVAEAGRAAAGDARAYLCTVAANLGLDRQRRAQWMQVHLGQRLATQAEAGHGPDVADGLMYRQALAAVERTLGAMPARMREVFAAHRIHGEAQADIAGRLGVSLNTVERDLLAAADRMEAALRHWRGERTHGVRSKGRRSSLAALLGLAGVGVFGTLGWRHWRAEALRWQASLATSRGRTSVQTLADGSQLTLDALSRIELAFDAQQRRARLLEGAAFFAVTADAERPFVVQAGEVTVTVLGTRFGVELEPGGAVLVQVESGRVQVARGGVVLADALQAGQGLRVSAGGAARPVSASAAPWREGRLHFDAVPLAEATERLERYALFGLHTDARAARLRVSGTVDVAQVDDWLQALPAVLPVRVLRQADGGVLLVAR
ncbi:MAG: sigma-70 family RNA polymerase sigma factor [Comamonadaceae bacterium]|nr:MAG: sigma-70 family RNA polymerase sigma factor [Comamonadaceae bacterium]